MIIRNQQSFKIYLFCLSIHLPLLHSILLLHFLSFFISIIHNIPPSILFLFLYGFIICIDLCILESLLWVVIMNLVHIYLIQVYPIHVYLFGLFIWRGRFLYIMFVICLVRFQLVKFLVISIAVSCHIFMVIFIEIS